MLLSNHKYVDPKIAIKLHGLQTEYQKLLVQKYQIQNNGKLQPITKNSLLKYNQTNLFQTKKMIQKYKLSLVDYFDEQVNQITKNCIQNENNNIIVGKQKSIQKLKKHKNNFQDKHKNNFQDKHNFQDKQLKISFYEEDSHQGAHKTGLQLSQLCENQLNSTKDKIQDSSNRRKSIQQNQKYNNQNSRQILAKSNADTKSDNRSTNNKSSFYTLVDKSKNIDRSMQIGQFNITSKFQRMSLSRPYEQQDKHKQKISSILQNYNKVSSIYYKKKQRKVGYVQRRFNKTLLKRINQKDRIIQSLFIYIDNLHEKLMQIEANRQMKANRQIHKSNYENYQDEMNLLSRISMENRDSILKHSNISNLKKKNFQNKYWKDDLRERETIQKFKEMNKNKKSEYDTQQLLNLHRQKNVLLQQKVKKLQDQLKNNIKNQKQTNSSYVIQLNAIMNKNKQLQKIQLQNEGLKMQRTQLIRKLKDFNSSKLK